ncbi:hypothetical protein BLA29_015541 [Euroglyphus maynei]|uniref:Uncharacterized protein n=1 Tax=Euroglyphus maynei TaxID=6958 RepID=A0A1Y3BAJ7_EURMA|nr:hypothetical protein BLA29_015541 [Euroglyphus maynei]
MRSVNIGVVVSCRPNLGLKLPNWKKQRPRNWDN